MKKNLSITALSFAAMLALAACNNEEMESPPPEEEAEEQATNNKNDNNRTFNFSEFDLDVEYKGINNDYDVDYEIERNEMEAKIEDEVNDRTLRGDEALAELSPKFEKLTFDQNTSEEEVKKEVLDIFGLKDDFESFELDIRFADGMEKEYNFTQNQ
ncbi:hypothetical protein FZC66_10510 [Priestia megaterium]|nr:hypothetical protein FZC66_10510 [Priestia megaterium]